MTQGPSELELTACALRAVNLGLLVVDADLRVALWNQWMVDTSGISSEQAIGRTLHELFPSTRLRRLQRKVDQVLTLGIQGFFDARATGALLPLIMRRIDIDPALAGGVVLTTVTDVVGFVSFLGLAALFYA